MPLILRKINKSKWVKVKPSWLEGDDVQADTLCDLSPNGNKLSVWQINDDKSNLNQILTAYAAAFRSPPISHIQYIIFDQRFLSELGIKLEQSNAKTPDQRANACHYDLVELSGTKLNNLAKMLFKHGETDVCLSKELIEFIAKAIETKEIERDKIDPKILPQIDEVIASKNEPTSSSS